MITRILIADDHPIVRQGLKQAIEREPGFQVIADAGNGIDALQKIRQLLPDIAILDINMPDVDGFQTAKAVQNEQLAIPIIFLTAHREESFMNKAIELGVKGYVLKDSATEDIVTGIKAVLAGEFYVSPSMTTYLINRHKKPATQIQTTLSPTERTVLKLVAEYKTTKDIAAEMFISPRTVETHRANICQKLGLQGTHALVKYAMEHRES